MLKIHLKSINVMRMFYWEIKNGIFKLGSIKISTFSVFPLKNRILTLLLYKQSFNNKYFPAAVQIKR